MDKYIDRKQAGKILAALLAKYANKPGVIILALPRGGVPVAYEIAKKFCLPLGLLIVRKLGVPTHEELAMGAIASGNITLINQEVLTLLRISKEDVAKVEKKEKKELARREALYDAARYFPTIKNSIVLLIDDGIATGATIKTAIAALRRHKPLKIIIAVPVVAASTYKELLDYADDLICPLKPKEFSAVGLWYQDFSQTTDDEVRKLLKSAASFEKKNNENSKA